MEIMWARDGVGGSDEALVSAWGDEIGEETEPKDQIGVGFGSIRSGRWWSSKPNMFHIHAVQCAWV